MALGFITEHHNQLSYAICKHSAAHKVALLRLVIPASAILLTALLSGAALAQDSGGATVRSAIIPGGTDVKVKLLTPISSDTAKPGDRFKVIVASDDSSGLPTATAFIGHVTFALPATPSRPGELNVELSLPIDAPPSQAQSPDQPAPPITDDASANLTGRTAAPQGHVTGIAAAGGALLGFLRKGKLGDAIEGGAIGAVGGTAVDQSQKHSAGDVVLKPGTEITVKLDRAMKLKTIVVPDTD
jgi:hypothetical protein